MTQLIPRASNRDGCSVFCHFFSNENGGLFSRPGILNELLHGSRQSMLGRNKHFDLCFYLNFQYVYTVFR